MSYAIDNHFHYVFLRPKYSRHGSNISSDINSDSSYWDTIFHRIPTTHFGKYRNVYGSS